MNSARQIPHPWGALLVAAILWWPIGALATPEVSVSKLGESDPVAARRAEVQKETAALEQAQATFKAQQDTLEKSVVRVGKGPVIESEVEKARIDMETVEVDAASTQMDLVAAKHQVEVLHTQISDVQDRLTKLQAGAGQGQDAQVLAAA